MRRFGCVVLSMMVVGGVWAQARKTMPVDARAEAAAVGFGRAVALAAGEAFIGEPSNELSPGAVYVFRQDTAEDPWTERQRLEATDGTFLDEFGWALAVEADRLVAGAPSQDGRRGAAYVFRKAPDSGQWVERAKLTAHDIAGRAELGTAVALRGDYALVGAPYHEAEAGAAYLFRYDAARDVWEEAARLTGSDGQPGDRFGYAVALTDDEALVGAYLHNDAAGAVYVFRRDAASGLWEEAARLTGSEALSNAIFGFALTAQGNDELLIGAHGEEGLAGAVYVFGKDAADSTWTEQARLIGTALQSGDRFGRAMAVAGDELWIAAPFSERRAGSVYVYRRDSTAAPWAEQARLTSSQPASFVTFGLAVALDSARALAGASGEGFGSGAAYVFERDAASGQWAEQTRMVSSDTGPEAITGAAVACAGGVAARFPCGGVDLLAFLPTRALGGARGAGANDLWGWTDPQTGNEYALVGRIDGTGFVDVTDPVNPVYLGNLPTQTGASTWRDIKTYADHAFIVADAAGQHGVQIFDLTQLRGVTNPPVTFAETARYDGINSAHNIAINEATGFAYVVGASGGGNTCGGGLHMVDIRTPTSPTFAGCFADARTGRSGTGYAHDAQCVVYHGPDAEHQGREICFGSNETALSIADVTDKQRPLPLAVAEYPNVGYTHQGWLTDDHRVFFQDDELDEFGQGGLTRTLIWDVTDLDDPQLLAEHSGQTTATDHNQYIVGTVLFQSNYAGGLRVLDISDVAAPREVAYFDVYPAHDGVGFDGSWSNYPFFASGTVLATGREAGLFILRPTVVQVATEAHAVPEAFALAPAFPNPFNPATTLTLTLAQAQHVRVAVYTMLGREVAVLHQGPMAAGTHPLVFAADALPSGAYLIRAEGATAVQAQLVTLVK